MATPRYPGALLNLLELSHDCLWMRGMDDKITFWNRSAAEHYGWGSEEAIGAIAHDLLRTEFPKPLAEIKTALKADGCWEGELKHRTRRGDVVIVASRLTMLSDAVGEPEAIL